MSKLTKLSIHSALDLLKKKEISAVELTEDYLKKIDEQNDKYNAFITVTPEIALEQAKAADKKIEEGKCGILEGIPIAIKDLFCTKGVRTTAGSAMLSNFIAPYESTVTQKLFNPGSCYVRQDKYRRVWYGVYQHQ